MINRKINSILKIIHNYDCGKNVGIHLGRIPDSDKDWEALGGWYIKELDRFSISFDTDIYFSPNGVCVKDKEYKYVDMFMERFYSQKNR